MKIDNLMCQLECSFMHDFEGAWVYLQSVRSVHFREDCNAYELLLNLYAIYGLHTRPWIFNLQCKF